MSVPLCTKRQINLFWFSLLPRSHALLGCAQVIVVRALDGERPERYDSSPSGNSHPLSSAMLRKIVLNLRPCLHSRPPGTVCALFYVLSFILKMSSVAYLRSVNTSRHAFVPAYPTTQSISQCPSSSRVSMLLALSSMLRPFVLFSADVCADSRSA